jgi:hypothetical protein
MKTPRDLYQRKVYAVARMIQAMARQCGSQDKDGREKAAHWVEAWASLSGIRRCKLQRRKLASEGPAR